WMDALQQEVERELACYGHDDLAVEHELCCATFRGQKAADDLREVARQRLTALGPKIHFVTIPERHTAEAVPLRLELPSLSRRKSVDRLRLHRREAGLQRQLHCFRSPF